MATYNFTGAIQYVTVPQGAYTITAAGAEGGSADSGSLAGGLGAAVSGNFSFQTNTKLIIIVGQAGGDTTSIGGGGGGGGTFVFVDTDNDNILTVNDELLLAAGGGGGAGAYSLTNGRGGYSVGDGSGNGEGGPSGSYLLFDGGGGAGVYSGGGSNGIPNSGSGAPNITSGGSSPYEGYGGFGGGGGGGYDGGGGGGGYSGGAGGEGQYAAAGGEGDGGRSYIGPRATSGASTAATHQGDGQVTVTCYVAGTLIRTVRGEVPVEELVVGERVFTAAGEARPIRWIGTQTLDCRSHPKPGRVLPIRIAKGAFGSNRPSRDLWVSPRHGLCLDLLGEVLVPADSLINGATVTQESVETVTYWHVELDSHDLLMAEGLAAESYLDIGNRGFFGGAADAIPDGAGPDAALTRADCCRPFVEAGPILDFARERLRERAVALGWSLRPDPVAGLHILADGQVVAPRIAGTTACFLLPAGCGDVRLVSDVSVPEHVTGTGGRRRLGVDLRGLSIDDGLTVRRTVALDDARLAEGFHGAEGTGAGLHRWTKGDELLPASLWAECQDVFFLRVELGGEGLLRWQAPEGEAVLSAEHAKPPLRLVEAA